MGLSQFMQWLLTSHVRRYHQHYQSSGHIWQGRFKSFPIQKDEHLLTVLRYVLQNPVRAGLAKSAGAWAWSSLRRKELTDALPVEWTGERAEAVEKSLSTEEVTLLRECVSRQRPFGTPQWQMDIARVLGLEASMRSRGRPRTRREK